MNKVVEVAMKYVGEKELSNNKFTDATELGKKLHGAGQKDGDPWCALFCEVVFKEAYPERFAELDKMFSASAVQTYKNFLKGGGYLENRMPKEGNLVIWQMMKEGVAQWQGHAGIVKDVKSSWEFTSIEGNTNDLGGREGVTVAIKDRKVLKDVWNGLKVLGFIQI
jgi:hypothetical protein